MTCLSDPVRGRILHMLAAHELSVAELQSVLQLPQSTVSRHLKTLADEGWITARAEGTSRWYRMVPDRLESGAMKLWQLVNEQVSISSAAAQDGKRLQAVVTRRRGKSQSFFSSSAGEWDSIRRDLFGERADLHAMLGLLDNSMVVGDFGCGTGQVSETLAPFVASVVAVDESSAMLTAARRRLGGQPNVTVRSGTLESLPVDNGELDAALLLLVLHHVVNPAKAIAESARTIRPGGKLLIVDMTPHDRHEFEQTMGHLWLGFPESTVAGWMRDAGLEGVRYVPLPADPAAKGPALFAATAHRMALPEATVERVLPIRRKRSATLRKTA